MKSVGELANLDERVKRARQVADHPKIEVTAFEAALPSPYARDTLTFLQRRYPAVFFTWIMGGDNLAQFHKWRQWVRFFHSVPIFVADRPAYRHEALASPAAKRFIKAYRAEWAVSGLAYARPPAWTYVAMPLCDVSSTEIRKAEAAKKAAKSW